MFYLIINIFVLLFCIHASLPPTKKPVHYYFRAVCLSHAIQQQHLTIPFALNLEYLEVLSLLKRSTCYDTPQVSIHSHLSAVVFGLPRLICNIAYPWCGWPSSWSLSFEFSLKSMGQEAVLSFDVPVVSKMPLFR